MHNNGFTMGGIYHHHHYIINVYNCYWLNHYTPLQTIIGGIYKPSKERKKYHFHHQKKKHHQIIAPIAIPQGTHPKHPRWRDRRTCPASSHRSWCSAWSPTVRHVTCHTCMARSTGDKSLGNLGNSWKKCWFQWYFHGRLHQKWWLNGGFIEVFWCQRWTPLI